MTVEETCPCEARIEVRDANSADEANLVLFAWRSQHGHGWRPPAGDPLESYQAATQIQ